MTFIRLQAEPETVPPQARGRPWGAIIAALLCGLAMIGLAVLPYDTLTATDDGDQDVVSQMKGDAKVATVKDVIGFYRLDGNVEHHLEVTPDGFIHFRDKPQPRSDAK